MTIENVDSYFTIARQHLVCEDYALAQREPVPHILVSDGCSTSEQSDIGARLLTLSASKTIHEYVTTSQADDLPTYGDVGHAIINRARHVADILGLRPNALDATMLLAFPQRGQVHVYVYGDGCILTVNLAGEVGVLQFTYANNMPYYLSYWIDHPRRESYVAYNQEGNAVLTLRQWQGSQEDVRTCDYDTPQVFSYALHTYRLIALCSDGIGSLYQPETQTKVSVPEVAARLVGYKTTKGDFVKRRVRRMLKEYEQQGIALTDDLSVATLLIGH